MLDMIKKNKGKLIISSIIILLPVIVGLILWNALPDKYASHWNIGGEADGWAGKAFQVFAGPCLIFVIHWICVLISCADSANKNQSNKLWRLVFWICPAISLYSNALYYSAAMGLDINIESVTMVFVGLTFILIGNYLPKCKQNSTIGIKLVWTLRSEENWNRTHRLCGKLWAACGFVFMISVIMSHIVRIILQPVLFVVVIIVPVIYSFIFYKKQCKTGFGVEKEKNTKTYRMSAKMAKIAGVIIAVIMIAVGYLLFSGDIAIEYGETLFTINADFWQDMEVSYDIIDSIEYRTGDEPDFREAGFGSVRLMMGTFSNDEFGRYTRYTYRGCKTCVVLKSEDETLVVNGRNDEETKKIYEKLLEYSHI